MNMRWATRRLQTRNTSRNVVVNIDGVEKPLCDWAESSGINYFTLWKRNKRGVRGRALIFGAVKP